MSDVLCPFCKEEGFDLVGLKGHLQMHCEAFDNAETPNEERQRLYPCICAQGVTYCPDHGNQPAERDLCPQCQAVLGYCPQGEYCTKRDCHYMA